MKKYFLNVVCCSILFSMVFAYMPVVAQELGQVSSDPVQGEPQEDIPPVDHHPDPVIPENPPEEYEGSFYPELEPMEERTYIPPSPEDLAKTAEQVRTFDCTTVTDVPQVECEALVALYGSTNGAGWTNHTNWLENNQPDTWYAVYTEGSGHVRYLDLWDNNLVGTIPSEIGNLTGLYRLWLNGNSLSGFVPSEIGNMTSLEWLGLYHNHLTGSITPLIGSLSNLTHLYLYDNQLSGSLPVELGNLSNLQYLDLSWNQLSGIIPSSIGNLSNLRNLTIESNQLSGSLPAEIGNLSQLNILHLYSNQLTGSIPDNFSNLTNLTGIWLGDNQLTGSIPTWLGSLLDLDCINFQNNQFSGSIPVELTNLSVLNWLNLGWNELTGEIPSGIGDLGNLTGLLLNNNQLTGTIPTTFGNLTNLAEWLELSNNNLEGSIPSALGSLTQLRNLRLNDNRLSGMIPESFLNLTNLCAGSSDHPCWGGFGLTVSYNQLETTGYSAELIALLDAQDPGWATTQTQPFNPDVGSISGTVYRSDGTTPIAGATIWALTPTGYTYNFARSESDGSYTIPSLKEGAYLLKADSGGYAFEYFEEATELASATPVTVLSQETTSGIDFTLGEAGSISGTVTRLVGGDPIAGAWVYILDENFNYVEGTISQSDGSYQFPDLDRHGYYVGVDASGYGSLYFNDAYDEPQADLVTVVPPGEASGINFQLSLEATISGHVYHSDGMTPLAGITLYVQPVNGGAIHEDTSLVDGSFLIGGLATGDYIAWAAQDGYVTEYYDQSTTSSGAAVISVTQPVNTGNIDFSPEARRTGAWVDAIEWSTKNASLAISSIKDGSIDMYADGLSIDSVSSAINDPSIDLAGSNGLYYELTLNPATFTDTSKLNPFAVPKIREALNWLVDRDYLNQSVFHGLSTEKFFPMITNFPDYTRFPEKVTELEAYYAYNPTLAESTITTEMLALGATKVNGQWTYSGQPVTIILLIRNDSDLKRIPMGDYVADQLESIGFLTNRLYKRSSEASPIWIMGNPADGLWHIYTGAWSATMIDTDEGDNYQFFYSPDSAYGFTPLWQAYTITQEFRDICNNLAYHQYDTFEEYYQGYERAMELALEDSSRIWLIDGRNYEPRRATTTAAYDLAAGGGTPLWAHTLSFLESKGGTMKVAVPDLFVDPWNPIAGSNWAFDNNPKLAIGESGTIPHPSTGLPQPHRIESAEIIAQSDLLIRDSSDWLTLIFADEIQVPADAWVDWDATSQQFITRSEAFPSGRTAKVKSVVTYPADLFDTVTWHDGSPLDLADFVMNMIITFDRGKPESPIFDQAYAPNLEYFMTTFRGVKIVSTDPLVIETYYESWSMDAEFNVATWWPEANYGPTPWHTTALASLAEANLLLAFSADKADLIGAPWTNYLSGPSISILSDLLSGILPSNYIPYSPTMSAFITPQEAFTRWHNLQSWVSTYGHFWLGTGPFFIENLNWAGKTMRLQRFADYPDASGRYDEFAEGSVHYLATDYSEGSPGSTFTIIGNNYPPSSLATVYLNYVQVGTLMTDSEGRFEFTINIPEGSEPGLYLVTVSVNPTYSLYITIDTEEPVRDREELQEHIEAPVVDPLKQIFLPLIIK